MSKSIRNDTERENWVNNDEGLYNWWKSTKKSMRDFVRENREELDKHIDRALGCPPATTNAETAYGSTVSLSFQIKVF